MSIRSAALQWLASTYGVRGKGIYASKFYTPEESWPKQRVWWFEIPLDYIKSSDSSKIHLVCQVGPNRNDFHYLKIPIGFFCENLGKFDVRQDNGKVSIYLSAVEERGKGGVNFKEFLVSK